jgi:hypothetical protein
MHKAALDDIKQKNKKPSVSPMARNRAAVDYASGSQNKLGLPKFVGGSRHARFRSTGQFIMDPPKPANAR